jgi:hypothetical protein
MSRAWKSSPWQMSRPYDRTVKLAGDEVVADFDDELDVLKEMIQPDAL